MKLTHASIEAGESRNGGWSEPQLALIGVPWPPVAGWKDAAVGREVPDADYQRFLSLKDAHLTDESRPDGLPPVGAQAARCRRGCGYDLSGLAACPGCNGFVRVVPAGEVSPAEARQHRAFGVDTTGGRGSSRRAAAAAVSRWRAGGR